MLEVLPCTGWDERKYLLRVVAAFAVATFQQKRDTVQGCHVQEAWQYRFIAAVEDGKTPVDETISLLRGFLHAEVPEVDSGQPTEKECVLHNNKVSAPASTATALRAHTHTHTAVLQEGVICVVEKEINTHARIHGNKWKGGGARARGGSKARGGRPSVN